MVEPHPTSTIAIAGKGHGLGLRHLQFRPMTRLAGIGDKRYGHWACVGLGVRHHGLTRVAEVVLEAQPGVRAIRMTWAPGKPLTPADGTRTASPSASARSGFSARRFQEPLEPPASLAVSCLRGPPQGRFASPSAMALRATLDPGRSSTGWKRASGPGKRGSRQGGCAVGWAVGRG